MSRASARALPVVFALCWGALGASAQAPPEDEPEARAAVQDVELARRARTEFEAGIAHFQAREYREAIHSFQVAAQLVPSADLWFNIARAHEELSEWEQAIEFYRRYLRDRVDPPDRTQVEEQISVLEERAEAARAARLRAPTNGSLSVRVDVPGSSIELDERRVGDAPSSEDIEIPAGRHRLHVEREGYVPSRSEVAVEAGLRTAAYIDLEPETRYRAVRSSPIFAWITFGLSAAALGTGIYLGVEASSRQSTDLGAAREWGSYSDAAIGGAIGLAALGIVLYFVESRAVGTERIPTPEEIPPD